MQTIIIYMDTTHSGGLQDICAVNFKCASFLLLLRVTFGRTKPNVRRSLWNSKCVRQRWPNKITTNQHIYTSSTKYIAQNIPIQSEKRSAAHQMHNVYRLGRVIAFCIMHIYLYMYNLEALIQVSCSTATTQCDWSGIPMVRSRYIYMYIVFPRTCMTAFSHCEHNSNARLLGAWAIACITTHHTPGSASTLISNTHIFNLNIPTTYICICIYFHYICVCDWSNVDYLLRDSLIRLTRIIYLHMALGNRLKCVC